MMESKSAPHSLLWIGICITITAAGCGHGGPKVEFAKVQGTVLVNGRPQPNVQVLFIPDREKGIGLPAYAGTVSDDKGDYKLKYSYMNQTGEGAAVGWSRVTLIDMSAANSKASAIPPIYGSPTSSPLLVEVKAGDNTIPLEVKK
jgi:hypothetical protein